ncbi:MAG: hypothetical protein Q8933_08785, partial [Bacteroidota bacterium]|nr:hypothetical protein [Bacteroidota bacterium]MDP4195646.1 hypothetical protein [Bacteroidota bacterium]
MGRVRHYLVGLTVLLALFLFSDLKAQINALNSIGGFESDLPSYWKMGKQTGATLSWATDQSRSMGRSLKIVKTAAT